MITILPGFLGTASDFQFLRELKTSENVIIGYSMGGRLALHGLLGGNPYDRAVIISAGLNLEEGREERRANDEAWAGRFESDPWDEVIRDWNAQTVFGGHSLDRSEADYDRHALALQLCENSPGVLPPLAPRLHEIGIPLLWIAGERDATYVDVARRAVALLPRGELWICPGAGHRVPWEQPQLLLSRLREFLGAR